MSATARFEIPGATGNDFKFFPLFTPRTNTSSKLP